MCKSQVPTTPTVAAQPAPVIIQHQPPPERVRKLQRIKLRQNSILRTISPTARVNINLYWDVLEKAIAERRTLALAQTGDMAQPESDAPEN